MVLRPAAVAFDVVETLFSLEAVRQRFVEAGLSPELMELWFAQLLGDSFALTVSGEYRTFREVASSALEPILVRNDIALAEKETVLGGFAELEAHPDAQPALQALADADIPAIALTNGAADMTQSLVEQAGLTTFFQQIISVDVVQRKKPHPEPYHYAARSLGIEPGQLALVAVHSWDILGARSAGLIGGWASRLEGHFPPALGQPDVAGKALTDVVDGLLQLPAS